MHRTLASRSLPSAVRFDRLIGERRGVLPRSGLFARSPEDCQNCLLAFARRLRSSAFGGVVVFLMFLLLGEAATAQEDPGFYLGQGRKDGSHGTTGTTDPESETGEKDDCEPDDGSTVDKKGDPNAADNDEQQSIFVKTEVLSFWFPEVERPEGRYEDVIDGPCGFDDKCACGVCTQAPVGQNNRGQTPTPFSGLAILGDPNSTSVPHTTVRWKEGEGVFYFFPHLKGQPYQAFEKRHVDGTIERFEYATTLIPGGERRFRPVEIVDPHDNRTRFEYTNDRVSRIYGPDGVDQIWDYDPSWIDDPNTTAVEGWDSVDYAGVEIRYVDRLNSDADLNRTEYRLFKKRRDAQGNLVGGTQPFSGDILYRIYRPSADSVDSLADIFNGTLYDITTDASRLPVVEYAYLNGTSNITSISRFTTSGVLPTDTADTAATQIVAYTYVNVGGRNRVLTETQPLTGRSYTFAYQVDVDSPDRVQQVTRTDHDNVVKSWTLDDYERVLTMTTTPPNDAVGRPRASDPDSAGFVSPVSMTRTYTYSACGHCSRRASVVEDQPSGRRWEYDYDPLTGLLEESRLPNPDGSTTLAKTTYVWDPATPSDLYGAYRLKTRTEPDSTVWSWAYTEVPRQDAAWGSKVSQVITSPPPVTIANVGSLVQLQETSEYDTTHPDLSSGQQQALVGQVESVTDLDGVKTAFYYNSRGILGSTVRGDTDPESITTDTVFDPIGNLLQVTRRSGSSLSQIIDYTYDDAGRLKCSTTTVGGQQIQQKFYYDSFGNEVVRLRRNRTHAGLAPDDFGPTPRADVAREWLRDEWHYVGTRLRVELLDRRALDRSDGPSEPVFDDPDARFARRDYTWSADGWLLQVAHANGSATSYTYDGYGSLYKSERTGGGSSTLPLGKYFVNDSLEVVRRLRGGSALGLFTSITRNPAGYIESWTEPSVAAPGNPGDPGYPWMAAPAFAKHEFDWDSMGRQTAYRIVDGSAPHTLRSTRTTLYDQIGRPYQRTLADPGGASQVYTTQWSGGTRATLLSGPGGRSIERVFDTVGRLAFVYDGHSTVANRDFRSYHYTMGTALVERVDQHDWDPLHAGGPAYEIRPRAYVRDTAGRVVEMREGPTGSSLDHKFTYYTAGFTESYEDPAGKVFRYLPDARGRIREHYLPSTSSPIWNEARYLDWTGVADQSEVIRTDSRLRETRTVRDFAGRVLFVMNPGATTQPTAANPSQPFSQFFEYDSASRVTGVHQGDDILINLYRDGMGRLITRSTSGGNPALVSIFYGRDILIRNALGQVEHSYSLFGPHGLAGQYVEQDYDRDALGRTHRESYRYSAPPWGPSNWVDIESSYSGGDWFRTGVSYRNNLGGNVDDLWCYMTPDATGRLESVQWSVDDGLNIDGLADYVHHGQRIRQRTTHWGTGTNDKFDTTYSYDAYGRMDRIAHSFSTTQANADVEFHFDQASNLTKEVYQKQVAGDGDRFDYDEHHRLSDAWLGADTVELANPGTGTFVRRLTYGLDSASNRSQVDDFDSATSTTVSTPYLTDAEPPAVSDPSNRYNSVGGVAFTYDARGNTTYDGNHYYVYDALNRLSEVYILVGDSTTQAQVGTSGLEAGALRETEAAKGPFVIRDAGVLADARKRLLAGVPGGRQAILWRHDETLFREYLKEPIPSRCACRPRSSSSTTTSAAASSSGDESATLQLVAIYQYDPANRRVARFVMQEGSWFYAWDGWQEAEELFASSDAESAVVVPERQFSWGRELDELLAYRFKPAAGGPGWSEFHVAEGGAHCPVRVVDGSGVVQEVQEYTAFGVASVFDGSGSALGGAGATGVGMRFSWRGHRFDNETGFLQVRHRYYSPKLGRFVSVDPLGVWGDARSIGNAYVYGAGNPLTRWDRSGTQWEQIGDFFVGWYITGPAELGWSLAGGAAGAAVENAQNIKEGVELARDAAKTAASKGIGAAADLVKDRVVENVEKKLEQVKGAFESKVERAKKALSGELSAEEYGKLIPQIGGAVGAGWSKLGPKVFGRGGRGFPPNGGFLGKPRNVKLCPPFRFDRYGDTRGRYGAPEGTPFEKRSLPDDKRSSPYNVYEVAEGQSIDALEGPARPWYGQEGLGTQYEFGLSVQEMLDQGLIIKVDK